MTRAHKPHTKQSKLPTIEAEVCDIISSTKEEEDVLSKSF